MARTTQWVKCACADPQCPHHKRGDCGRVADSVAVRNDMEDRTGTPMCGACMADALMSGLFSMQLLRRPSEPEQQRIVWGAA